MKNLKHVNRELQKILGKERFEARIEKLIREGLVEIIDCEDDGTPIVDITDKGMNIFLSEIENIQGSDVKYKPTLGEHIERRLKEENLKRKDLDAETIDFFYLQWLVKRKRIIKKIIR